MNKTLKVLVLEENKVDVVEVASRFNEPLESISFLNLGEYFMAVSYDRSGYGSDDISDFLYDTEKVQDVIGELFQLSPDDKVVTIFSDSNEVLPTDIDTDDFSYCEPIDLEYHEDHYEIMDNETEICFRIYYNDSERESYELSQGPVVQVEITEVLQRTMNVVLTKGQTVEDAVDIIKYQYDKEQIELRAEHLVDTNFKLIKPIEEVQYDPNAEHVKAKIIKIYETVLQLEEGETKEEALNNLERDYKNGDIVIEDSRELVSTKFKIEELEGDK